MTSLAPAISQTPRSPRLGEAVFIWTGFRLETGRVVGIEVFQPTTHSSQMRRFHIYLIHQDLRIVCGREDFALVPELRQIIPRMRQADRRDYGQSTKLDLA